MQQEPGNHRYRGWRESKKLVETAHAAPCDLALVSESLYAVEVDFDSVSDSITQLLLTTVSQIQHIRTQLRHRIRTRVDE